MKTAKRFRIAPVFAVVCAFASVCFLLRSNGRAAVPPFHDIDPNANEVAVNRGAAGLSRWLAALRTRASVLMVVAHPDDEDGGMLTFETRGAGARGTLLTLNRGEGGQNAMSIDMYDALGLVRTQELLQADRFYGVDQYWTRAIDYGFSKTREEGLQKWGHDRVLSDVVRVIRMTRPLVITAVFIGAPTDGHGQHQVSGEVAQEAYLAAGDPAKFPEQIREGLRPWTPLKVYARVPFFRVTKQGIYDYATDKYGPVRFFDYVNQKWSAQVPETNIEIDAGKADPADGLTFSQIAREGWGYQKTQNGGGTIPPPGPSSNPYHRYGSRVPTTDKEKSFFNGIDVSLGGIADLAHGDTASLKEGLAELTKLTDDAADTFNPYKPSAIAPLLADGLKKTRELSSSVQTSALAEPGKSDVLFELGVKENQFQKALSAALGLQFDAVVAPEKAPTGPFAAFRGPSTTFTIAVPDQSFGVEARLYNESPESLNIEGVSVLATDGKAWTIRQEGEKKRDWAPGQEEHFNFAVRAPSDAALTRPYFSRPDEEQAYYNLNDERYRNLSLAPYPLRATLHVDYQGTPLEMEQVVHSVSRIEGIGIVEDPLTVGPALSVSVSPAAGAVPLTSHHFEFTCTLHTNVKGPANGVLRLRLPEGWQSNPSQAQFSFARDGENETLRFQVTPNGIKAQRYEIKAVADYKGETFEEGYRLVGYPGLRPYPYYRPASYEAVGVDVKTAPGLKVAFLPGTGDDVPRALEDLGLNVRFLSANDVETGDLSSYDAIVLGVRAYTVQPELRWANARLLDYVRNGGVLLVQYNLTNFDANDGPYPFSLGSNPQKVVDEGSAVELLEPKDPALMWPNRISTADFRGWIEERGHGFMKTWDPHYQALVETHDPDQDPQKGGLLVAKYGKGAYIYDAFALYRQLPSGVPGAYRILANLVSLGKNPEWK
ncbi:MAG TPA: PIG-L family deacetylase [Bryobacteraceae bacterium]|jgi:LmbE family N-acetylglucosaminyl deacetylase|nr:PIG-L family deacetylase [Bryobacteraceae bacterium]